jgi:poly(A) polymerase
MVARMVRAKLDAASIPEPIRAITHRIRIAGGNAWLVGGTVRDLVLGLEAADYDLATDLDPQAAAAAIGDGQLEDARLGACRIDGLPWPVVVTTLRIEGNYRDHRRPDFVQFVTDPTLDSQRRDFTCNAIYADAQTGEIFDPTGGLTDLASRTLRAIGDPAKRFEEDPLRLLRLLRFEARFGLAVDPVTEAAAKAFAKGLCTLSKERVFDELTRAFCGEGRGRALRRFVELGFANLLMPEVAAMEGVPQPPQYHPEGCVLTHVALVLDRMEQPDAILAWSAVLHDVGKPPTFRVAEDRIRFDGHDVLSARMADSILERFHASRELRLEVSEICRDHIRIASLLQMRPRRRERWMRSPLFAKHLAFHRADCLGSHGDLSIWHEATRLHALLPPERPPLVTGADVLALGVPKGPVVGQLLRAVEDALDSADGIEPDRDNALVVLRRLAVAHVKA